MSSTNFIVTKHIFPGQHIRHYAGATRNRDEETQYLEAKQYTPINNQVAQDGDITIIGTCAASFPKEMFEPLWDELLQECEREGLRVRSIWSVDRSDHGASGVLNEYTQGDDPSSCDLARDILNMINIFRDQMTTPVVGVGHSMGGTALLELARIHPRLFSSLVLIDPIIGHSVTKAAAVLVHASSRRQDLWPSREEAEKTFKSSKHLQRWDPRVMKLWLEYGLRETPTLLHPEPGNVTLRTTKATEAWNYARNWFDPLPGDGTYRSDSALSKYPDGHEGVLDTHPFYGADAMEVWNDLPRIRCSVLYLFPEFDLLNTAEGMEEKVARTGSASGGSGGEKYGRAAKAVVEGTGHLAPFERPAACARIIVGWLSKDIRAWERRKKFEAENRDDKSVDRVALSERWMTEAKHWFDLHVGGKAVLKSKL